MSMRIVLYITLMTNDERDPPPQCGAALGCAQPRTTARPCRDVGTRYPLSPVSEMPSMNVRCVKKKAITIGMVMIELTAIK